MWGIEKEKEFKHQFHLFFQFSEADDFDIPDLLAHWNSLFDIYFYFDKSLMLSVRDEWEIFIKGWHMMTIGQSILAYLVVGTLQDL